jgi:hypothetical protein
MQTMFSKGGVNEVLSYTVIAMAKRPHPICPIARICVLLSPRPVELIGFQVSKSGAKGNPLDSRRADDFPSANFSERYRRDSECKWYGKADLFHRLKIISGRFYEDRLSRSDGTFCGSPEAGHAMLIPYASMVCICSLTLAVRNRAPQFQKSSSIASSDGIKPSDAATLMSDSVPGSTIRADAHKRSHFR